nr:Sterol 24-C-methyltransferase [Ipomoea batatas]
MKDNNPKPFFIPKCFLFSLLISIPFLLLFSHRNSFSALTSSSVAAVNRQSEEEGLKIRPGYASYESYIQRQLNKTLNPKLRKIWTTRDWARKIQVFTAFFGDLKGAALLSNSSKALCIGARMGQEVEALRRVGVSDSIGIDLVPSPPLVVRGDFHRQPFAADTFDFEFSNVFDHALYPDKFVGEIERTLKPGGVCVLHVIEPLKKLFKQSELVRTRTIDGFGLDTEVIFRKKKKTQSQR